MPSLSVVMIVKNEAACLGDCLASVQSIADEIVVGDTGSTDDTVAVAKGFGAKVFDVLWRDDFAYARNCVLKAATGDWLLSLDADEVVDEEGARRIREVVDADGSGANGIEVTLANYCDEARSWRWVAAKPDDVYARGYAGYVAVGLVRLFKNGQGFEYREAVHENLGESLAEHDAVVRIEPITIHHYGFDSGKDGSKEKIGHYLEIARQKVKARPDDFKAWFDLASASSDFGDDETAEDAAGKSLALNPRFTDAASILANLYMRRGDYDDAQALLEGFVKNGAAPPIFAGALGAIAYAQGRLDDAQTWLQAALEANPKDVICLLYRARICDQAGDGASARGAIEKACAVAPSLTEPRARLDAFDLRAEGEAQFQAGRYGEALELFVRALKLDAEDPLLHNDTGVALNALGEGAHARESFERALLLSPAMTVARENLDAL